MVAGSARSLLIGSDPSEPRTAPEASVGRHLRPCRADGLARLAQREPLLRHQRGDRDRARARDAVLTMDQDNGAALPRVANEAERLVERGEDVLCRLIDERNAVAADAVDRVRFGGVL